MPAPSPWTPERVEKLTRLWKEGLSASECARELGGFTHCKDKGRSACLGKLDRLGLLTASIPNKPPQGARRLKASTWSRRRAEPSSPRLFKSANAGIDPDFDG